MLGEMFDLDQTSPNIAKHDVRSPNKVCKRSNISPNMMLDQMLGEMLDRLHKPLEAHGRVFHNGIKPRPNALDFSLYIARQMSSIVECCREGVAKRSRLFIRLGTQHSTDVLFDE